MSFANLGLSAELLRAIADRSYGKPTPVQSRAIPVILEGKDVLAGAQTGTGKTAGFALPLLQILSKRDITKAKNSVRALILTPTRELAAQIQEDVESFGKYLPLNSAAIFGGVGHQSSDRPNPQRSRRSGGNPRALARPRSATDPGSVESRDISPG